MKLKKRKEITEFKESLEFTKNKLHGKIWRKYEEKIDEVFCEKLGLDNIHIEYVHHVKRGKNDKSKRPGTIVCNLLSFKEKKLIMKTAKKTEKHEHFYRWRFLSWNDPILQAVLGRSKRTT